MLKGCCLFWVFTILEIGTCQKPPRIPYVYLPGEKFSLPPICSNAAEWQDSSAALEVLADKTEPKREKSAFTSLMNLIKFVLVKEELSCPVLQQMTRGKISKSVTTLQNGEIIKKIEAALARKPPKVERIVEIDDYLDIPNMLPVLKSRSKARRRPAEIPEKCNSTYPEQGKNVGSETLIGATAAPVANVGPTAAPVANVGQTAAPVANVGANCQCSKCTPCLNLASLPVSRTNLPRLQAVNLSPVMGCGGNCNICQKLSSAVPSQCRSSTPVLVMGCQQQSLPVSREPQVKSEEPLMNCYGNNNMLNKVNTKILVPCCLSKLI